MAGAVIDAYKGDEITIFTLFDCFRQADHDAILRDYPVKTSPLQRIPGIGNIYRFLLPVMPWAMKQLNIKGFDVIISTSHAVAKGFRSDGALHVCYCHTPMRYVWDMYDDYAAGHRLGRSFLYRSFINYIRRWDLRSAGNVHYFIANSRHVQQRIKDHYKRDSVVIYPPVRVNHFALGTTPRKEYYLCMGRFVPYKKTDLVVRAFKQMPDKELILIGEGYGTQEFKELLQGAPNIKWLGYQDDTAMIRYMQEARACIYAAKEDFGIMCVESQACGTPVLALDYGGYRETVADGVSGYFFKEQTEASIVEAVAKLEAKPLGDHAAIREHAMQFSDGRFERELRTFVDQCRAQFKTKA